MKRINLNYVALAILLAAYVLSALRFFSIAGYFSENKSESGKEEKVIRVAHWQLEPGYRDALNWAIEKYNDLPQVKAAGVRVEQAAITERVYNQFMNVHLISGTAPDIAAKGNTQLIKGNAVARYYAPLGEYINDPNPYNAAEYLGDDLDAEYVEYISNAPWKDTYIDGMLGGYDTNLDDYYAVPISTWGGNRLYYNATILKEVKAYILAAEQQKPQPEWLQNCWIKKSDDGEVTGYLPDDKRVAEWLKNDKEPQTLGQLFLYCEGVQAYALENNLPFLVPISGSNYSASNLGYTYQDMFLTAYGPELEVDIGSGVDSFETMVGWDAGVWDFDSPPLREAYRFSTLISRYFPPGFIGLDREQAQRRFILGNAAVISSGGWDASSILTGAKNRDDEKDVFKVIVSPPPLPAEGERWADLIKYRKSEADTKTGVPLAINKQSKNFDWALDFLRFVSSKPINEGINQRAKWLSTIVGAENVDEMKVFTPIPEGTPPGYSFYFNSLMASIKTYWTGQSKLVMTGELSYDEFAKRMDEFLRSPRLGMMGYWFRQHQDIQDRLRANDRSISIDSFNVLFNHSEKSASRLRSLFSSSLSSDEAVNIEVMWQDIHPGEPFPEF